MITLAVIAISLSIGLLLINFGYGQGQSVEEFSTDDDTCTGDEGTLCANANNPDPTDCIITKLSNLVIIKPDCGGVENYSQAINKMLIENFTIEGIDSGAIFMEKIK